MQKFKRNDSVLRCTFKCRYRLVVCYQKTYSRPLMFLCSCLIFSLESLAIVSIYIGPMDKVRVVYLFDDDV